MTDKERFRAIMSFEPFDRMLYWEQGFWGGTVERWYREGMPRRQGTQGSPAYGDTVRGPATPIAPGDRVCPDVGEFSGLDKPTLRVPVELYLYPPFEEEVLEESADRLVVQDEMGIVKRMPRRKDSIPHFLAWPVSDWPDLERIVAERLDPKTPGRFPSQWDNTVKALNHYDGVVALGGHPCGLFGSPRYLLGEMALLTGFLDRPEFIRAVIDHLVHLWSELYDRVLSEVKVDCVHIWEDMAFKNGPLISPALFEEFLVPAYCRLADVVRSHGVKVLLVDTDGRCSQLIPLFLAGGVTGLYPFEVQAGMDVRQVREAFPHLQLLGGIDKKALALGPEAIDAELERRIPGMVSRGGYVPMGDHQIPPDVSWENYRYYRSRLARLAASPG